MPNQSENPNRTPGTQSPEQGKQVELNSEEAALNAVRMWQGRIKQAKDKWEPIFKLMRENMEFCAGLQWDGQRDVADPEDRYIANWTLRVVEQKVANLYARNPEAEAIPRDRMNYELWDGSFEMARDALMGAGQAAQQGGANMLAQAILKDIERGRMIEAQVKKVCKTLQKLYQYQVDCSRPEFKEQMKQAVRRAIICGVAYVRPAFVKDEPPLSTTEARHSMVDRAKMVQQIATKLEDEKIQHDDALVDTLRSLVLSMGHEQESSEYERNERIEFDFPPATSVIPDVRCRHLKDFVSARFVAQEFILPVDEVNAFFGLDGTEDALKVGMSGTAVQYELDGQIKQIKDADAALQVDPSTKSLVCVWNVLDHSTKTHFFICDGHKKYLQAPEPLFPCVNGFWPLFALTFNDHESDPQTKAGLFPQSDVQLIKSAQREWNRTRNALRDQRNANAPTYLVRKGTLSAPDKVRIQNRDPNEVIDLEGVPPDVDLAKVITTLQVARIDPALYDTKMLSEDAQITAGVQEANIGPAQPNVTATVGTIAEQSRITITSSNVDDLDGFLSRLAQACGEMLIQGMPEDAVKHIVGPGAVWPSGERADILNSVILTIKAASSGRPNKALETANFERIAPVLLQAGANPQAIIEEGIRRMDERLDVTKFFPVPGAALAIAGGGQQPQQPAPAPQPLQTMPPGAAPVPLAAA